MVKNVQNYNGDIVFLSAVCFPMSLYIAFLCKSIVALSVVVT